MCSIKVFMIYFYDYLSHFMTMFHFYTPEKFRKLLVSWRFQEVWKRNIGVKWVNMRITAMHFLSLLTEAGKVFMTFFNTLCLII